MNRRLVELVILEMDSQAFEDLVFSLVHAEEPAARQLKPPDAGRDTIVGADENHGELVWQVKHHTSGINWSKCEKSLKDSIEKRNPEVVTFVFPVNMTEGKEAGLTNLRERYPRVRLPEPWTMSVLLEKLDNEPEIRRHHIDKRVGVDEELAQKMLERGAELRRGWDERLSAALRGPLAVLELEDEARAAQALLDDGKTSDASQRFEAIAAAIGERMPAVADGLLMNAAAAAVEAQERKRAADLYLRASLSAAARGDSLAEYAAFRASWNLPEEERWRSSAATARAIWQENQDDATRVLRGAFDRTLADGDTDGVLEWAGALCEVLAAEGNWVALEEVTSTAIDVLGPVERPGPRLDLELELLSARSELGHDLDPEWSQLLLTSVAHDDESAALINARWGMAAARRGQVDLAIGKFRDAAKSWRLAGDAEEEIGEAILSEDVLDQVLGGQPLGQANRIAVAQLRGREIVPTVLADRKEAEGLRAWLAKRGWDARRNLLLSWSIHRRAGHLAGCLRLAEALCLLFKDADERAEALRWAIRCGQQVKAKELAQSLSWTEIRKRANPAGPPWERGASFEAIAVKGTEASDEEIREIAPSLLDAAKEHADNEHTTLKPGPAARRALATLLCGIPEDRFPEALAETIYEIETTPFPPAACVNGLLLATGAGLSDEGKVIVEVFAEYGSAHLPGYSAALELIETHDSARDTAIALADRSLRALLLCAWAELPNSWPELARQAAAAIATSLEDEAGPEDHLTPKDRGCLARWASAGDQAKIASDLVDLLISPGEIGVHRYEAAKGLGALAKGIDEELAADVLDRLVAGRDGIGTASTVVERGSDLNPAFARALLRTPAEEDHVVAMALRAEVELAARTGRLAEIRPAVEAGIAEEAVEIRAMALDCAIAHRDLLDVDLRASVNDADPTIRALALKGLADRGELKAEDPALLGAAAASEALGVRSTAMRIARADCEDHREILGMLARDSNVFIRAAARNALRGTPDAVDEADPGRQEGRQVVEPTDAR